MLLEKIRTTIIKHNMIDRGDTILIGISGGYDSVALTDILIRLKESLEYEIFLAHINHCVRGKESDDDEEYVRKFAEKNRLKLFVNKVDMNEYSKKNKLSPEESGRKIRYDFFNEIIFKEIVKGKIVTAHNKNDSVETVILNLIRGTSIDGLKGIDYRSKNIIRPLLDISRKDIEKYCEIRNLNPRMDSTNLEKNYGRNKIRLDMIPFIEENFNSNFIDSASKMSELLREDNDYLYEIAEKKFEEIIIMETKERIEINNLKFKRIEKNIKSRILKIMINRVRKNLKGINHSIINEILDISNSNKTGKKKDLFTEYTIKLSYDKLILEKIGNFDKIRYNYKIRVFSGSEAFIKEISKKILIKKMNYKSFIEEQKNNEAIYLRDDDTLEEITIRSRENGDRIKLKGILGAKRLKNYFIDKKIPRENRDIIPIIEGHEQIIAIMGYCVSEEYSIEEKTENIIKIEVINI